MKKQSFLKGSAILLVSVIITKLIGAFFKIPLSNLIGGEGMGYFSAAYGLFMPVYALSVTGLPTAVAKLVAENCAEGKYKTVRKIKNIALILFSIVGMFASALLIFTARPFTEYVTEIPYAMPAVTAIAPSVFFGCIMAVYRGYYEGMRNMYPTAISQVIEAIVKLIFGLGGAYLVLHSAESNPEVLKKVISKFTFLNGDIRLDELLLPFASAAAVFGITISTAIGMIFLILCTRFYKKDIISSNIETDKNNMTSLQIIKELIYIMIPAGIGSLITNLTSLIDLSTISKCIKEVTIKAPQIFDYLNIETEAIPNFIYGSFIGLAVTIFNLIPSMTNMFGKGILPNLTEAWTIKDMCGVKRSIEEVIFITGLIAIPSGIGITVLSREILEFLFNSRELEIAVSANSLSVLGIGVIFLSLSVPVFSMMQAVGKPYEPIKIMAVGVIIKLIGNLILIPIPQINIVGAGISTTLCYIFICFMSVYKLSEFTKVKVKLITILSKPLFCGILCGISARLAYDFTCRFLKIHPTFVISIAFSGAIYLISSLLSGAFPKRMLKNHF